MTVGRTWSNCQRFSVSALGVEDLRQRKRSGQMERVEQRRAETASHAAVEQQLRSGCAQRI